MKTQSILIAAVALILGTEAALVKRSTRVPVLRPDLANALHYSQISLSKAIHKEAKLIQVPEQSELELHDLHFAIDNDISVKLSNLKLLSVPSIDITSANPNLEFLNLALDVDYGTLEVGGNFEIVSKKILTEIPVKSSGEFTLRNNHFKTTGKVGLSLQTNFFKTINYNVAYQPTGSYLTVSYLDSNKRTVSNLEVKNQEAKVVAHINRELNSVLNRLVKKRLDNILGGVAVDNLIGKTGAVESYREHTRALRAVGNDYVDALLEQVHTYIVENELSEIGVPNIEESFSQEILGILFHGSFVTTDGRARNFATLERTGDFNLDINEAGVLEVSGYLGLAELKVHYNNYKIEFQDIGPSGSLTANVGENSIFLKISIVLTPEISITIDDFRIEEATSIEIEVTGLGIFDWLVSQITTWVVDLFHDQIVGLVESQLKAYIEQNLSSITIPLVS